MAREEAKQESPLRTDERMELGPRTMGCRLRSEKLRPGACEREKSPAFWGWD